GPAGAERLTVKVKLVVPALPSLSETSLIVRFGRTTVGVGTNATPCIAVFVAAVASDVRLPVIVALYPEVSVNVCNVVRAVTYNVTFEPLTVPVRPRTFASVIVPFAVQFPLTSEYFRMKPLS